MQATKNKLGIIKHRINSKTDKDRQQKQSTASKAGESDTAFLSGYKELIKTISACRESLVLLHYCQMYRSSYRSNASLCIILLLSAEGTCLP